MEQQRDTKRPTKSWRWFLVICALALLSVPVILRWMTPEVSADGVAHPPPLAFEVAVSEGPSELAGSETCERCHADIVAQWSTSAHRYSGLDNPWYRSVLEDFQQDRGAPAGRWCAGCHTPALLLSGQAERPVAEVASAAGGSNATGGSTDAGVSCLVCHGMTRVDSRLGQGDYEIGQLGVMHDLATSDNPIVRGVHDLLVRIDPEPHRRTYSRPLLESSEFCASCHAAHFDEPINSYRRFKYFDDYEAWQGSQVSGQSISRSLGQDPPGAARDCVDCHMAPSGGTESDGAFSHRFAAANTALPTFHGAADQLRAVEESLTAGRVSVDLFALRVASAAGAMPALLDAPLGHRDIALYRGEAVLLDVVVSNRDVGHAFPGGKLDLHDIWLEVRAVDETGRTVFWSGRAEEGGAVEPTAHRYGMLYADEEGRRIDHHEMWRSRADVWRNTISAGDSQVVRYRLEPPADAGEEIELSVRLRHRKFRPEFTARVFADLGQTPPAMPVLTLAKDSLRLPLRDRPEGALASAVEASAVEASAVEASAVEAVDAEAVERWRAYGIGLAGRFERRPAQEAFRRLLEVAPEDAHGRVALGWLLGPSRPEGRAELEAALELDDNLPLAQVLLGNAAAGDDPARALELLRRGIENHPHDAGLRVRIGNLLFLQNDFAAALGEYEAAFASAPETAEAHYGLMRTLTALGDHQRARKHQAWYSFLRADRESMRWSMDYLDANPQDAAEGQRRHLHHSVPLREPGVSDSDEEVSP